MAAVEKLLTDHLDLWTAAIKRKSTAGRGSSGKIELYGIKKLRELILELAVRGLLVSQDSEDEPASKLLKDIAAEKAKLVKEGKIKKEKPLPPITEADRPYQIPAGWNWVRLGEVGNTQTGGTPKKADLHHYGSDIPFIKPGDIIDGEIASYENDGLSFEGAADLNRVAHSDSVVMVCIGTIGKCARVDRSVTFNQQINSVSPFLSMGHYTKVALQSNYFQSLAWKLSSSTTISILNKGKWEAIPFPLPPLAEQHRIVAKVDDLMALCDQLAQQTDASHSAHQTLVETLLNALTSASDHAWFASAWQRIAAHFDTLFTSKESIDQLKQSILQLAVMGKLVPQDSNDEPASELLKRIASEKVKLVKEGKIKKETPLSPIGEDEKPFELPTKWEWTRLSDISDIQSGIAKGKKYSQKDVIELPYLRVANVQRGFLVLDEIKNIEILESEREKYSVRPRDLLITEGGDWDKVGRTAIWPERSGTMLHQNHVFKARLILSDQNEFWLEKYMNGPFARAYFAGSSKQTTNLASINKTQLSNTVLPLPPPAEQQRIVSKVDELMALCDQLTSQLSGAQTIQLHLADATTDKALARA